MSGVGILEGFVGNGYDRPQLIRMARDLASVYFAVDPRCISVKLRNEAVQDPEIGTFDQSRPVTSVTFSADFEAVECHRVETPTFGFPRCVYCKREELSNFKLPKTPLS